jgi:hypothetical protein
MLYYCVGEMLGRSNHLFHCTLLVGATHYPQAPPTRFSPDVHHVMIACSSLRKKYERYLTGECNNIMYMRMMNARNGTRNCKNRTSHQP